VAVASTGRIGRADEAAPFEPAVGAGGAPPDPREISQNMGTSLPWQWKAQSRFFRPGAAGRRLRVSGRRRLSADKREGSGKGGTRRLFALTRS
jgi:hypothetical protein